MKAVAFPLALILLAATSARADDKFEPAVPVRTTAPIFPNEMHDQGISGFVLVDCLVDEKGDVQDMRVEKSSNKDFIQPAIEALKKWKFKPAQRDGNKVATRVSIPIRFTISD
jgi:protein TonB